MEKITVKCHNRILLAEKGENLLTLLRNSGIVIPSECGGVKKCCKCKVKITPKIESNCKEFLTSFEYENGIRLACFIAVNEDMEVFLDKTADADILSIQSGQWDGFITKEDAVKFKKFGIVDIGTTTVTMSICDENFRHIKTVNFLNPQRVFGADVVSRIKACDDGHLNELQMMICEKIYGVLAEFEVSKAVIVANNIMLHILLGVSPHSIGVSPYTPKFKDLKHLSFMDVFGKGRGEVILLPSVSGYVGSDVVSGVIATNLNESNNTLYLDLGTNGEIVLNANGKLFCTSTASGPAFEGGNIACGSYARKGSIAKVQIQDGQIVVDDKNADAICGSGLIDLVAALLDGDIIDEMGGYNLGSPLVKTVENEKRVYLNDKVFLSQKDVRAIQLAKGAISCGIKSLLKFANLAEADVKNVYIAGGFSTSLNFKSCERIGLIPNAFAKICVSKGNSAILGALMCLKNDLELIKAEKISKETTVLDLGSDADFFNNFAESMIFE